MPMPRRTPRIVVAVLAAALPLVFAVAPARADSASDILARVNSIRASHGAAALATSATLTSEAQQWSAHMATLGRLAEPPLAQIPAGWTAVGSNIADATTVDELFVVWNDPGHMGNMVNPVFNFTGIATFTDGHGQLWATELFEALGSRPPPTTTVTPRVTAAPTTVAHRVTPITVTPTALTPTTVSPTTVSPTTVSPTTVSPTTVSPTTVSPVPPDRSAVVALAEKPSTKGGGGSSTTPLLLAAAVVLMVALGFPAVLRARRRHT